MIQDSLDFLARQDPSELRALLQETRKFAEAELRPGSHKAISFKRSQFEQLSSLGLTGLPIPETFGGSAQGYLCGAGVISELARAQLGPAIYLSVHWMVSKLIAQWDGQGNFQSLLQELSSGKKLGAFCLTEAQAGSDASSLRTKAESSDGRWRINGEKIYITSAGYADAYLVFARTGDDPKKGISAFVVEKDNPGISFGPPELKMGCEGSPIATVTLQDCEVPNEAVVGEIGSGYKIALSGLSGGRVNISAAAIGVASRALELARAHAVSRRQFGNQIAEFQAIQFMFADMATELRASILLCRDAAEELDCGSTKNTPASMAKCFATDTAMRITTNAVQILGGAGYLRDYEVERLMRDAKMLQIVEGTNQIQRQLIANEYFAA